MQYHSWDKNMTTGSYILTNIFMNIYINKAYLYKLLYKLLVIYFGKWEDPLIVFIYVKCICNVDFEIFTWSKIHLNIYF